MELIFKLLFCHLFGDYVLQNNFIASTKGYNWYHLFVHCFLYALPFYVVFGMCWQLYVIIATHLIVDAAKARYNSITYTQDQIIHYLTMVIFFIE